jgi:non-heme chloroperoxidase
MKRYLFLLVWLLPGLALAQPLDKYALFLSQKLTVDLPTGITMRYIDTGPREGATVVLLHGYTDSGRSFQPTIEALQAENPQLRIIVPDLRGHGQSSLPAGAECREHPEQCFGFDDFAADVIALLDTLGVARAHVVGHSLGSGVAQELALRYAGRVNSLVLIGTFVDNRANPVLNGFLKDDLVEGRFRSLLEIDPHFNWPADAYTLTPAGLGPEIVEFLRENWVVDPCADPGLVKAVLPETAHTPIGTWIGAIRTQCDYNSAPRLAELKKPTLILWASQDNIFLADPDQQLVKAAFEAAVRRHGTRVLYKTYGKKSLPDSGAQTDELGHNLQWGAPDEVAADIAAFISTGSPVPGIPYANPKNVRQIVIELRSDNFSILGK